MGLLEEMQWRGLYKDVTDLETLKKLLDSKATIYCGFDPTGPSLHIGHIVPVMMLKRFQDAGHKVIAVVGGGTGLIGDPSGRSSERNLLNLQTSLENAASLKAQLGRYLHFEDESKAKMVNNYDWLSKINMIEFLRDYGKCFPINYMLAKDTVARRLETGISFTEFSYMIIQSIDFYQLYKNEGCQLQMGGSDQWGNLTSGVELIRRLEGDVEVSAFTLPLITKSDGTKFGKSAGGALWLDKEKTSPYALYQYFLNTPDADVIHYMKVFTFLSQEEIHSYEKGVIEEPHLRAAQKKLAYELVKFIHGEEAVKEAIMMSEVLFGGEIKKLNYQQLKVCLNGVPALKLEEAKPFIDVLVEVGAASSKREARELLGKGTYSINGEKVSDLELVINKDIAIENKLVVIRRGKKNYYLVEL